MSFLLNFFSFVKMLYTYIFTLPVFYFRSSGDHSPAMSPVLLSENNYNWVEITDEFFDAIKGS
jgi:hypothetical protein